MNCMKGNDASEPPKSTTSKPEISNGAGKDRITENDKAIIDIKGRMRKLRDYEKKLEQ